MDAAPDRRFVVSAPCHELRPSRLWFWKGRHEARFDSIRSDRGHLRRRRVQLAPVRIILIGMLRRVTAALAVAGLMTSPVVASTRLFCRYTGEEIVGCIEQNAPDHSVVRGEACCSRQTVQPLDAAQPASSDRSPVPIVAMLPERTCLPVASHRAAFATPTTAAGPPVFIIHRALLI